MIKSVALVTLALVALACPAWAGATLDRQSAPASSDVTVTVEATVDDVGAYTDKVTAEVPSGFRVLSCGKVDGFTCAQTSAKVTWQRSAPGQPVPLATDHFPFRMHTIDKPGKYTFALTQVYSTGKTERAAPVLQVTANSVPTSPTTTTARVAVRAVAPAVTTARRAPAHVAVTEPAWFGDNGGDAGPQLAIHEAGTGERASSTRMVILGVVAALAAAGVFWFRRRVAALR